MTSLARASIESHNSRAFCSSPTALSILPSWTRAQPRFPWARADDSTSPIASSCVPTPLSTSSARTQPLNVRNPPCCARALVPRTSLRFCEMAPTILMAAWMSPPIATTAAREMEMSSVRSRRSDAFESSIAASSVVRAAARSPVARWCSPRAKRTDAETPVLFPQWLSTKARRSLGSPECRLTCSNAAASSLAHRRHAPLALRVSSQLCCFEMYPVSLGAANDVPLQAA